MKAINFSAAVENMPKQCSKVDLRSWYILNMVLLLDCTPSVIAMKLGVCLSPYLTRSAWYVLVKVLSTGTIPTDVQRLFLTFSEQPFTFRSVVVKPPLRALTTMSTNNIDSNKCKEKAGGDFLCGIAEVSDQIAEICASCGIAEVDNVKLKKCACKLVKYCSIECQKEHRSKHKRVCRKRMAELRDKILFTQPVSSCFGDCPICFLSLPIEPKKSTFYSCCSKIICKGCDCANDMISGGDTCPFCRETLPKDKEEFERRRMKRVEAGDPAAMVETGTACRDEGDYDGAVKYWKMAAELGSAEAHYHLGVVYESGQGVEKDEEKAVYQYEKAAIGGHPGARFILGCIEGENGRFERSVKHFIIAAKLGVEESTKMLLGHYNRGNISKDDLDATLRTHQAAVDAMKSPQREAAAKYLDETNFR
jgi:hypothetical protein